MNIDFKNITTVYSSNIMNVVIIFLGVLTTLLVIKIIHIKYIQYKQNKIIKKKLKEEEEEAKKLKKKLDEEDKKIKDNEMKELNINLNLPKKSYVSTVINEIPGVPTIKDTFNNVFIDKQKGILHQVSKCDECDLVLCDKKQLIDEEYPEDHYSIGKPLKDWGCKNTYIDIPKVYDKISGKIYVLEKLKENIKKDYRVKPTIHLINNCNECDNIERNWCDKNKYVDDHNNSIDHYNVGVPLSEYGCEKFDKDSEVVRDGATDNIYVIENMTKDKHKDYTKYNDGYCQNEIIGTMENPNIDICFNRCLKENDCNYISFDEKSKICNRYKKCSDIKTDIDSKFTTYKKKVDENKKLIDKKNNKSKKNENIESITEKFKKLFIKDKTKTKAKNKAKNDFINLNIYKYSHINLDDDQRNLIKLLENNKNYENKEKIKLLEIIIENKKDLINSINEENYELSIRIYDKLIENQKKYKKL